MNKIKRSLAIIILAVITGLFIAAISYVTYSQKKQVASSTDAVATTTDIIATPIDIPSALVTATFSDATETDAEEIEVVKAEIILDNRKDNGANTTNKTVYNKDYTYVIEDAGDAFIIRNFNTNEIVWCASPIKEDYLYCGKISCLRQTPNTDSKDFIILKEGYRVQRVAVSKNGWDIVKYGDYFYFIWCDNLTYEPIKEETTEAITEAVVYAETPVEAPSVQNTGTPTDIPASYYSPYDLMYAGVIYWGGYTWTWYSENVLPGYGLDIPGRYTDGSGFVCDGDGYICLASSDLPRGTVVDTLFGRPGKVYDCGCASGVLDVYVGW